jgi:hypothetical protein
LGIGTTSPIARLNASGGTTITSLTDWNSKANTAFTLANSALRIGIGYDANDTPLIQGFTSANAARDIAMQTYGGNLLVGTTDSSGTVGAGFKVLSGRPVTVNAASTDATTIYEAYSTGAAAYRFYVGMGGTIFATSITITAISDERLKENVRNIDTGLDAIMALKPRRFDWKEGKGQDKKNVAGFIAQEFETVFPECVSTSKAGEDGIEYKNINHETLIPTLVKAMQEQQALITQLTARITALEGA